VKTRYRMNCRCILKEGLRKFLWPGDWMLARNERVGDYSREVIVQVLWEVSAVNSESVLTILNRGAQV
jgi:hypothetical protein